jgi:anthranilate synthase component I
LFYGENMTLEEFTALAHPGLIVPVTRTLLADELTPVSAYLRIRRNVEGSFLFESVEGGESIARYSFIGCDPATVIVCREGMTSTITGGIETAADGSLFDTLRSITSGWKTAGVEGLPRFTGGLVGYIGYDAVRFIEKLPCSVENRSKVPDAILGLFTTLIIFDHLRHQVTIAAHVTIAETSILRKEYENSCATLDRIQQLLFSQPGEHTPGEQFRTTGEGVSHEISQEEFGRLASAGKEYIGAGDIFQVVLSQRFSVEFDGDPFSVYRALRVINPSPYLYYLDIGGTRVIGSSPEILVRMENGTAEVYPIAGTRWRGATRQEDKELGMELLADAKETAEHVMLVDLGRNDLGRVCLPGSVRVDPFKTIVRYSHVMHIASRVAGQLKEGVGPVDVFMATFPAGTVSGAPKIRAMEIIDELEPSRRSLYAGGVGYFDFTGNMDFCIAIRTMVTSGNRLIFQAGAGIVADSVPEREYEETLNKARALVEAVTMAERITR